jgi:hypothetical protein
LVGLALLLGGLGGCTSGGCLVDHSELISMDPSVACLQVKGADDGSSQCVDASLEITNNCSDTLTFADGWTNNGGKLVFPPGTSGYYDAKSTMKVAPHQYVTTATLGQDTITFVIKTHA